MAFWYMKYGYSCPIIVLGLQNIRKITKSSHHGFVQNNLRGSFDFLYLLHVPHIATTKRPFDWFPNIICIWYPSHFILKVPLPSLFEWSTILSMTYSPFFDMLFLFARAFHAALLVGFSSSSIRSTYFSKGSAVVGVFTTLSRNSRSCFSPIHTTSPVSDTDTTQNGPSVTKASWCFLSRDQ